MPTLGNPIGIPEVRLSYFLIQVSPCKSPLEMAFSKPLDDYILRCFEVPYVIEKPRYVHPGSGGQEQVVPFHNDQRMPRAYVY